MSKNHLTTERYKQAIYNACLDFKDLKTVQKKMRCSTGMLSTIGIDEHSIKKPKYKNTEYTTMIVDHNRKKNL